MCRRELPHAPHKWLSRGSFVDCVPTCFKLTVWTASGQTMKLCDTWQQTDMMTADRVCRIIATPLCASSGANPNSQCAGRKAIDVFALPLRKVFHSLGVPASHRPLRSYMISGELPAQTISLSSDRMASCIYTSEQPSWSRVPSRILDWTSVDPLLDCVGYQAFARHAQS